MYYVHMKGHDYSYEIYEILTIYYPREKICVLNSIDEIPDDSMLITSSVKEEDGKIEFTSSLFYCNKGKKVKKQEYIFTDEPIEDSSYKEEAQALDKAYLKKEIKHGVKVSLFMMFRIYTGIEIPWGVLVGIRPTKIVNDLKRKGLTSYEIYKELKEKYIIRDDRIKLVTEVSDNSYNIINKDKKNVSLYIGIPFCPTRCVYCSFASYPITKFEDYVPKYLDALNYEIKTIGDFINSNFNIDTIYIGGGTPTSLNNKDFSHFLDSITNNININNVNEFTVEAVRPDTINAEKLKYMIDSGVNRISINPQTMNDSTLKRVGRNHTVNEIIEKYHLARDMGFKNINMDMIIGLMGENIEHVKNTVKSILDLSPENITVHTMALKRASKLKEKLIEDRDSESSLSILKSIDRDNIEGMMDYVYSNMKKAEYIPYYMYRQKHMVGNLENVGYAKKGFECIYNIQMIEEKETIIGLGADSVTKMVFLDENRIERFANKKDLDGYINTIEANTDKKIKAIAELL